jgi:hypothetical protein
MSNFGLIIGPRGDRQTANLIPSGYGAMIIDTDLDGVVDGFTHGHHNETSVLTLDATMPGQKVVLAAVTNADAYVSVYLASAFAVSPNTAYGLSVDAALLQSGTEKTRLHIDCTRRATCSSRRVRQRGRTPARLTPDNN